MRVEHHRRGALITRATCQSHLLLADDQRAGQDAAVRARSGRNSTKMLNGELRSVVDEQPTDSRFSWPRHLRTEMPPSGTNAT